MQKENEILSVNADNAFQEGLNESRELFKQEVEAQIKAEAVKELQKRIHEKLHEAEMNGVYDLVVTKDMFDDAVKEMGV